MKVHYYITYDDELDNTDLRGRCLCTGSIAVTKKTFMPSNSPKDPVERLGQYLNDDCMGDVKHVLVYC